MFTLTTRATLGKQRLSITKRLFTNTQNYDALVLNAFTNKEGQVSLAASKDISQKTKGLIEEQLKVSNFKKAGDVRTLYNVGGMKQVAIVSLGEQSVAQKDEQEAARRAVSRASIACMCLYADVVIDCPRFASIEVSRRQACRY